MPRWLAWAAACVLLAALVGAGIVLTRDDRPSGAVVSAAGNQRAAVDVTSTVTVPLAPPASSSPSTVPSSTTLPKAAVDVLNAIGASTTTTRRAPATTRPPAPTTTVPTPTTVAPVTTTTIPTFNVTLVNNHPHAFVLVINGRQFPLAAGQTANPVDLPVSPQGDLIQVRLAEDTNCGVFDSGVIFQPGGRYRVSVVPGPGMCGTFPSPFIEIARLP